MQTDKKELKRTQVGCLILIAVFILISGIMSYVENKNEPGIDNRPAQDAVMSKKLDASAIFACREYRRLMRDFAAGILTVSEIRDQCRRIHDAARLSPALDIRAAGQAMLRAVTQDNAEEFISAAGAMSTACVAE